MSRLTLPAAAAAVALVAVACDQPQLLEPSASASAGASTSACVPTGTGLTAKVVNQDVTGGTIDVGSCDVGAFFDTDGSVQGATFVQPDENAGSGVQYAVLVEGASVNVRRSSVDVVDSYARQFIGIGYRDGATGTIADNTLTGFHRVGILVDGAGSSATVRGNAVTGVGEKSTGWAENGIQVSRGAGATVIDNRVENHWWNLDNFSSAGVIVYGSDQVTVRGNELAGNDLSIALLGDRNVAVRNEIAATAPDGSRDGVFHYGAFVSGENNALVHNDFRTTTDADIGVFVTASSVNTKLIGNTFAGGFGFPIYDGGDDTKLPAPFVP